LMKIPFAPKYPLSSFARSGCRIFLSKKKPLLLIVNLATQKEVEKTLREHEARAHEKSWSFRGNTEKAMLIREEVFEQETCKVKKFLFKSGDDLR
jgi:hypothetical protein